MLVRVSIGLVEDREAPAEVLVGHSLRCGKGLKGGKLARADRGDEVLAEAERVEREIDPEERDDEVERRKLLGLVASGGLLGGREALLEVRAASLEGF